MVPLDVRAGDILSLLQPWKDPDWPEMSVRRSYNKAIEDARMVDDVVVCLLDMEYSTRPAFVEISKRDLTAFIDNLQVMHNGKQIYPEP